MNSGGVVAVASGSEVIYQATPTAKAVVGDLLVSLLVAGLFVAAVLLLPHTDPLTAWLGLIAPVIGLIRSSIIFVRGRVALVEDGIEVRRVRTRRYSWASLSSVTIDDDGYIEITPDGWVRRLRSPVPRWRQPST